MTEQWQMVRQLRGHKDFFLHIDTKVLYERLEGHQSNYSCVVETSFGDLTLRKTRDQAYMTNTLTVGDYETHWV